MYFLDKTCQIRSKKNQILHIRNNLGAKFQLKLTIVDFWIKLIQEQYFWSTKEKNENHHQILNIRFSLGSKF